MRGDLTLPCAAALVVVALAGACASVAPAETRREARLASCEMFTASGPDADEIRRLEQRGADTNVEGWTIEEARTFFAPEWASLQPDGSVTGLDAALAGGFQDRRSRPWAQSFTLIELDVRVYCDMAIVIGLAEARGAAPGGSEILTVRFRYLNVWRKQGGRWIYAANQFTRF